MKLHSSVLAAFVVSLVALSASAVVYLPPSDDAFIHSADIIAVVNGAGEYPIVTADGRIRTICEVEVVEVLKGTAQPGEVLRLSQLGGTDGTVTVVVPGTPRYDVGSRYLVFVRRSTSGELTTLGMGLGSFLYSKDLEGHDILLRGSEEYRDDGRGAIVANVRDAASFNKYVRAVVAGRKVAPPALIEAPVISQSVHASRFKASVQTTRADYLLDGPPRWPTPSTVFKAFGSQPGFASGGTTDSSAAMSKWNAVGVGISYSLSGTTTQHGGLETFDGVDTILFDDPNGTVASIGGGVVAIGGYWFSGTFMVGAETFQTIIGADVEVGHNLSVSAADFQAIMTHELGHTLGFRHSDGTGARNSPPPNCVAPSPCAPVGSAIMAHSWVLGTQNGLKQWDLDAANTVYGSGPVCTNVTIGTQPSGSTITSGQSANLSVVANGTSPFVYQWYQGTSGVTTTPVGTNSSSFNTGTLTTGASPSTFNYWVKITNCTTGSVNSNTATITVNPVSCTPTTSVTSQPQSTSIVQGNSAQLTVGVNGTGPFSYQWYTGTAPSTASPLTNNVSSSSINSILVSPSSTTSYWVRVTGCSASTVDSSTATVTVTTPPSCTPTTGIINQPQSVAITAGGSTSLSVTPNGTGPFAYQWYVGTAPDTSTPLIGGTTSTIFVSPSVTTSYWVRVTGCNTSIVNSTTATVTVGSGSCPSVTFSQQPTATAGTAPNYTLAATATGGTGITYTWFSVPSSGSPVNVGTGQSLNLAVTTTTTFYVHAQNDCGNSADSQTVTVTIGSCTPVVTQPAAVTVTTLSHATLTVTATSSTTMHYQWYKGVKNDTTHPVGTDSSTYVTDTISATSQYWVKVTNSCGSTSSDTITINAVAGRRRSGRK